ncbi:hypothetical protein EC957_008100 [Mortierella hygrophila]|uniref:Uncharacterized protein n=1 Tax=Mortierella hygrophila TaxID=979708 RepID=A0A9P6JY78_9FUNG|nr:hypothetical protein EC957_008100 [Mortierella hygrophila]
MSDSSNDPSTTDTMDSKDKQKSDQAPSGTGLRASNKTNKQSHKQEGAQLVVDTKRKAQRLIGRFLDMLRIRIEDAVAEVRRKKNGEALSERAVPSEGVSRESMRGLQLSRRHRLRGLYSRVHYNDPGDCCSSGRILCSVAVLAVSDAFDGPPASSLSYELLCQQYKSVKDQHARAKEQKCQGNLGIKSFVCATSDWRTLYFKTSSRFRQRDVMASENMNNAIKDHLIHQQRPLYLQPRRQDGSYPWMDVAASGGSGSGGGEAGGLSAEAMDISGDGAGGSGGGGAATARRRHATSIVSVEAPNTDVNPTADAPNSSSSHTKKKAKK